jgi:hypothetical protein
VTNVKETQEQLASGILLQLKLINTEEIPPIGDEFDSREEGWLLMKRRGRKPINIYKGIGTEHDFLVGYSAM